MRQHRDPRPDIAGENHPMAKLTEKDVLEILHLSKNHSLRKIAAVKKVSYSAVWRIVQRRSWKYLTRDGSKKRDLVY